MEPTKVHLSLTTNESLQVSFFSPFKCSQP